MIKIFVDQKPTGSLYKSDLDIGVFYFGYDALSLSKDAISLTMPVVRDPYPYNFKHQLHPIFDMNLPEGELRNHLFKQFSKAIPDFDDLALLGILGKHQIGRLRFNLTDKELINVPAQSVSELIAYDGAEDLFDNLLNRYAAYSGISGVQPKVLLRNSDEGTVKRVTHRDTTHIVKAWNPNENPQLAANEYFCMRAASYAKLDVPNISISENGKFLIIERFDFDGDNYLGFEDFCVLNARASEEKYKGSYENITRCIKEFVSPEHLSSDLETFFKSLTLSCAVMNGDAHLKNFGVLYADTQATVKLSPTYDVVTTTAYIPGDSLALTLGGSKAWPKEKALVKFAGQHCNITASRAKELMSEVAEGMVSASQDMVEYIKHHEQFRGVGEAMLVEWSKGLNRSILSDERTVYSFAKVAPAVKPLGK